MRIIVTDIVFLWNHKYPIFERLKDIILVVCFEGKTVSDQYECFVGPYKHIGLGIDKFGVEEKRFQSSKSPSFC